MSFDPAAHLTKQGWKGKGTALKHGHATRPLPVVQKKTLTGIGKDRDTSIPFWDHIFASTASSLFSSLPSSPVPTASPTPPLQSDAATKIPHKRPISGSWQTHTNPPISLSASARTGKEIARRGLYSRFFRGTTLSQETSPEIEVEVQVEVDEGKVASSSAVTLDGVDGGELSERKESKEERRARRAEKALKKAEKEAKKAKKGSRDVSVASEEERKAGRAGKGVTGKKRKGKENELGALSSLSNEDDESSRLKKKSKRKSKFSSDVDDPTGKTENVETISDGKKAKEKKKRKRDMDAMVSSESVVDLKVKKRK